MHWQRGALSVIAGLVLAGAGLWVWRLADSPPPRSVQAPSTAASKEPRADVREDPALLKARRGMIEDDLRDRDISDPRVLEVMSRVPRHRFVPEDLRAKAYGDHPLPIGYGQTISQPYIVALMTQLARPKPSDRALDVGTGSGYQAAVLAGLCKEVWSIEILRPLADQARQRLEDLEYRNVTVRHGDGYQGWKEHAPFDLIIVAAAPDHVPQPLIEQLAPGGRLVIPVGGNRLGQYLMLLEKGRDGTVTRKTVTPVAFVPMTGEAQGGPVPSPDGP